MNHWASQYIGRPHERGAEGPESFDCYHFTRYIQREHFGTEMTDLSHQGSDDLRATAELIGSAAERDAWERTPVPSEGNVTLMARSQHPVHIGVWIKANGTQGVLHCVEGQGVVFSTPAAPRSSGWGSLQHYRRRVAS